LHLYFTQKSSSQNKNRNIEMESQKLVAIYVWDVSHSISCWFEKLEEKNRCIESEK
jgi:hypothetical protein